MFSTLDATSLKVIKSQKPDENSKSSVSVRQFMVDKPDSKKKLRSKTGCLHCRFKLKKKCDEVHPTCTSCRKRGVECVWTIQQFNPKTTSFKSSITEPVREPTTASKTKELSNKLIIKDIGSNCDPSTEVQLIQKSEHSLSKVEDLKDLFSNRNSPNYTLDEPFSPFLKDILLNEEPLNSIEELDDNGEPIENYMNQVVYTPIYLQPSSNFQLFLDASGIELFDVYRYRVIPMISVCPDSSNYLLKTYVTLAATEEAILNSLAAWGAAKRDGADSESRNYYRNKAREIIEEKYINNPNLDKYGFYVLLAYYLIDSGLEVFLGDTNKWYVSFKLAEDLLRRYGSAKKFLHDFNYSNDAKFLIANFQYRDIMSSVSLRFGTTCKILTYQDAFSKQFSLLEYGIDPYQGCIQGLYLLMGEIFNGSVELKHSREDLNARLKQADESLPYDEEFIKDVNNRRVKHYINADSIYFELLSKIEKISPNEDQLYFLMNNSCELDYHLALFELYRNTCKLYLLIYIRQIQPISSEIQLILLDSFKLIDFVMESHLRTSLVMTLIACGVCCVTNLDRCEMRKKFNKLHSLCKVGNVKKALKIVEECWLRNTKGEYCHDWVTVCEGFGWKLSVC